LLFAIEVAVTTRHRRSGLEDPPLHVDEANRYPLRDVGHAGILANVVMKAHPGSPRGGRNAGCSRNSERSPYDELAARWWRDDHARPRTVVADLDVPTLMLCL